MTDHTDAHGNKHRLNDPVVRRETQSALRTMGMRIEDAGRVDIKTADGHILIVRLVRLQRAHAALILLALANLLICQMFTFVNSVTYLI